MMPPVFLVACVAQKRPHAAPARDLYRSDWFQKARAYVEAHGATWFILSARYGLVEPTSIIEPYDLSLVGMTASARRAWGRRVIVQLQAAIADSAPVVIFAGAKYRAAIEAWAADRAAVPMAGLGIGQQKAWLLRELAHVRACSQHYGSLATLPA